MDFDWHLDWPCGGISSRLEFVANPLEHQLFCSSGKYQSRVIFFELPVAPVVETLTWTLEKTIVFVIDEAANDFVMKQMVIFDDVS